jgi:transcriptional regulator with XRE-family HTH domain
MTTKQPSTQPQEGIDLRRWRETHNVKQLDLAKRAGVSQNLLSLLEAGKRNFTKDSSEKIYRAVKELNAERAERLTAIALNQDSRSLEIDYLRRKGASKQEREQLVAMLLHENELLRSRMLAHQQKEQREIGPLLAEMQAAWMERNLKPVTEELAEVRRQLADVQRLVGLKTEAIVKEAQAQDLQEEIEQRVKKDRQAK